MNRIRSKLIAVLCLAAIMVALAYDYALWLFSLPLILVVYVICAIAAFDALVRPSTRGICALPSTAFLIAVSIWLCGVPSVKFGAAWVGAQHLRLAMEKEQIDALIATKKPNGAGQRFLAVDWGGFLSNGIELVYDESDAVANVRDLESRDDFPSPNSEGLGGCTPVHLHGHYYVVSC